MKHDKLGGVSNSECHVGFAKSITLARQKSRVSDTPRVLLGNLKVTINGAYLAPPDDDHSNFEEDVKSPFEYHSQLDLFMDTFAAPCVHSLSHWVKRELTGEEFLTSMDIPAMAIKHAKNVGVIANGTYGNGLLASPPLKILQEAGDMLFGTRDLRASSAPSETNTDYILQSEIPGFEDIYEEINQSRAARNDDAGIDFDIWNEHLRERPSDWKTDWCIVGEEHDHNYEVKFFNNLRKAQHRCFHSNVERSYLKYMRESYVLLESGPRMNKTDSAKVTMFDSWNWERDKAAGIEALNKSRNSSFWDWDDGSFPFFWR